MKRIILLMLIAAPWLLLTQCHKKSKFIFKNYFWTSVHTVPMNLFIDGRYKGPLPALDQQPDCYDDELKKQGLYVPLKSGSYELEARDRNGELIIAAKLKIYGDRNNLSISTSTHHNKGDVHVVKKGGCFMEELHD